jgi:hypothetical protein
MAQTNRLLHDGPSILHLESRCTLLPYPISCHLQSCNRACPCLPALVFHQIWHDRVDSPRSVSGKLRLPRGAQGYALFQLAALEGGFASVPACQRAVVAVGAPNGKGRGTRGRGETRERGGKEGGNNAGAAEIITAGKRQHEAERWRDMIVCPEDIRWSERWPPTQCHALARRASDASRRPLRGGGH